ncbi:MAG: DUF3304 domain-containing protein [Massilia sp.]
MKFFKKLASLIFLCAFLPALGACNENSSPAPDETKIEAAKPRGTEVNLSLTGYNYTNRYINDFSVNGQSGGNIYVSGPSGGGGGDVCCVGYVIGARIWNLRVRWQIDGCRFDEHTDSAGQELFQLYSFYKEVEVKVDTTKTDRPHYLEVHFFPDGHLEAILTEHLSPPRLLLAKDREDKSDYKKCPNGERPEE